MTQQDDLQRFITAQKRDYETALLEIKQGRKQTHWMWYIFHRCRDLDEVLHLNTTESRI